MNHVIYGLFDPDDELEAVRYVGYTSKPLSKRLKERICGRMRAETHKNKWIRLLKSQGRTPSIRILDATDENSWQECERSWIQEIGREQLVNGTDGGDGLTNPSPEVRAAASKRAKELFKGNSYRKGIPHSDEDRKIISDSMKKSEKFKAASEKKRGAPLGPKSEETRAKLSAAKTGKPHPRTSEWTAKIALANTGKKQTEETKAKRLPSLLGNTRGKGSVRSEQHIRAIVESKLGSKRINNGAISKFLKAGEPLPDGWFFGAIKREQS